MDPRYLPAFDADWASTVKTLLPQIHAVDRAAVRIWFQLFPLALHELAAGAEANRTEFERYFQLRGAYRLADQPDRSHRFFFSHRYWPAVKANLLKDGAPPSSLEAAIREAAAGIPPEFGLAIAGAGVMTLRQVGPAFLTAPYVPPPDPRSAEEVLRDRASDGGRSLLSRLTTWGRKTRAVMDETVSDAWFPLLPGQHLTTAAELDKRPYHEKDKRCYQGMGPIPVDCRSGSCGTCWVGVLGGHEKLAPVGEFEQKRMDYFGYWESGFHDPADPHPLIRLACQTIAHGSCSLVIPPWNGVWGRTRRARSSFTSLL